MPSSQSHCLVIALHRPLLLLFYDATIPPLLHQATTTSRLCPCCLETPRLSSQGTIFDDDLYLRRFSIVLRQSLNQGPTEKTSLDYFGRKFTILLATLHLTNVQRALLYRSACHNGPTKHHPASLFSTMTAWLSHDSRTTSNHPYCTKMSSRGTKQKPEKGQVERVPLVLHGRSTRSLDKDSAIVGALGTALGTALNHDLGTWPRLGKWPSERLAGRAARSYRQAVGPWLGRRLGKQAFGHDKGSGLAGHGDGELGEWLGWPASELVGEMYGGKMCGNELVLGGDELTNGLGGPRWGDHEAMG
ncbi:hypothetical protein NL676_014402 [Syzygium grande]|nr:hypothetical protein NL676_014402 [Syzygium grande]